MHAPITFGIQSWPCPPKPSRDLHHLILTAKSSEIWIKDEACCLDNLLRQYWRILNVTTDTFQQRLPRELNSTGNLYELCTPGHTIWKLVDHFVRDPGRIATMSWFSKKDSKAGRENLVSKKSSKRGDISFTEPPNPTVSAKDAQIIYRARQQAITKENTTLQQVSDRDVRDLTHQIFGGSQPERTSTLLSSRDLVKRQSKDGSEATNTQLATLSVPSHNAPSQVASLTTAASVTGYVVATDTEEPKKLADLRKQHDAKIKDLVKNYDQMMKSFRDDSSSELALSN